MIKLSEIAGSGAGHGPGTLLESSVEVLSAVEVDGTMIISLGRAKEGQTSDHYTFDASKKSISLLMASGTAAEFGYHGKDNKSGEILNIGYRNQEKKVQASALQ